MEALPSEIPAISVLEAYSPVGVRQNGGQSSLTDRWADQTQTSGRRYSVSLGDAVQVLNIRNAALCEQAFCTGSLCLGRRYVRVARHHYDRCVGVGPAYLFTKMHSRAVRQMLVQNDQGIFCIVHMLARVRNRRDTDDLKVVQDLFDKLAFVLVVLDAQNLFLFIFLHRFRAGAH